jgi:hypothetical protein
VPELITEPASKSLKGQHSTGHTFATSSPTLSSNFDFQDCLFLIVVENDRDISEVRDFKSAASAKFAIRVRALS